jgi:transposase InsO family protein
VAKADDEQPALLLTEVCSVVHTSPTQSVFLNQECVFPEEYGDGAWILDMGATNHMTGSREALTSLDETVRGAVRFGDGSKVEIRGLGAVMVSGKNQEHRVLIEVYYIPSLKCNIISLGQLEEGGCRIEIDDGVLQVLDREQTVLVRATRKNRLYTMKPTLCAPVCLMSKIEEEAWRWHARYGHLNFRSLRELGLKEMVEGIPLIQKGEQVCDGCALGKQHRTPFLHASVYRAERGLELFHGDLCSHISPPTLGGKSFFLLIVDDYSRFMWLELLTTKDEAFQYFKKVQAAAEREHGRRLKAFRSDRGGEFNSNVFTAYCNEQGIKHNTTAPYSPQQNGVVERRNQSVVEMARCLLKSMKVPAKFWGEAVKTAVYILNLSPTRSLEGRTPFEAWYGKKPSVRHLRTFGCVAYAKRVGPGITKLADRSVSGVFFGYEPRTKAYRVYDPVGKKLMVTRDVIFDEKKAWNWAADGATPAETAVPLTVYYPDTVGDPTTAPIDAQAEPV